MPDPTQIHKPIAFTTPPDLRTTHCTHLVCAPLPGRYLLSFFECLPPLVMGTTEAEKQREFDKIKEIPATCVARIAVAEQDMASFLQVLQQQVAQMKQQQAAGGFKAFA